MTDSARTRRPRSRRRRAAWALLGLGGTLVLAGWLGRVPIATGFVDRELAANNVPARYRIADLGFGRQRLEGVVIGDPAHPDLVADWIETMTDVGLGGARLAGVRAGHVRVRGRLVDGRLSLGSIDRLLPKGTGGALRLPALDVRTDDARMRLETPWGVAGLKLAGRGRLDGGFRGTLAVASDRLAQAGCTAERSGGVLAVRTTAQPSGTQAVSLTGPLQFAQIACSGVAVADTNATVRASLLLGAPRGSTLAMNLATGAASYGGRRARSVGGTISLADRGAGNVVGTVRLAARTVRTRDTSARQIALDGEVTRSTALFGYTGTARADGADARTFIPKLSSIGAGTPIAPLADALATALARAGNDVSGAAQLTAQRRSDGVLTIAIQRADLTAASGVTAALRQSGNAPALAWSSNAPLTGAAIASVAGGGLPRIDARADTRGDALAGSAIIAPFAANGSTLALSPVSFTGDARGMHVTTTAVLSGPLANGGRVDRLSVPLDLRIAGNTVTLGPTCTPVAFERLAVSGLTLAPTRLSFCPTGGALLRYANGSIAGGASVAAPRLTGRIGATPLALAATNATLRLSDRGASLAGVVATLGAPGRETKLTIAQLDGAPTRQGFGGRFAGAGGQIANVPLLLSDAAGKWEMNGAGLAVRGALKVRDAQETAPRFKQLDARDVVLGLKNGAIGATGTLYEPTKGVKVADIAIDHRLGPGSGHATISVPALTFASGFQPDLVTPLTFGVIADVKATITGKGEIDWNERGVTSTGAFSTDKASLAAAFGPVAGITGTINFTDLLALESAPDQQVTIASVNPGVDVTDGRIVYRTLPGGKVQVKSGTWPFAGGTLTLEPTLLDLGSGAAKRMTFTLDGVQADQFLQRFDFKNLNATGTFDGSLPMVFDDSGGRIENGTLAARTGGGKLAYVGPVSEKNLGFWGNFAFQALKSLTYRDLGIVMNGPLAGEMVTQVRFAGVKQGEGAKSNFLIRRLTRLPIVFNITIKAPFRGLIDSATSFYDPSRLVQRNLPTLIEQEKNAGKTPAPAPPAKPIQPPASENVP